MEISLSSNFTLPLKKKLQEEFPRTAVAIVSSIIIGFRIIIKRNCNILGVPCNVDVLANGSLTITLGDHVIGEVGLQQPGTGETFYCWLCVSFAIACVSALKKLAKINAWNSFTNFHRAFLLLFMVNFPQNFLNPSCTWME